MMSKTAHLVGLLIVAGLLAGCATSGHFHTISFGGGQIEVENGTFHMEGYISVGSGAAPPMNFSNVSVVLYNKQKEEIHRVPVGTLSTDPDYHPTHLPVNITFDSPPKYVVIESLDLWTSDTTIKIEGHRLSNGTYYRYGVLEDQKFPSE